MSTEVEAYAGSATENAVQALAAGKSNVFSTIKGNDYASRMALYAATTDSQPLAEHLNKPIQVANVIVQVIDMADEQTGEVRPVPRSIIVAKDGTAYHAISNGIFKSIENMLGILGSDPSQWGGDVTVKAVQEGTGNRKYFTLVPVLK